MNLKRRWLCCCFVLLVAALVVALRPSAAFAENSSAGNDSLFDRLDTNRDGKIAPREVPTEHKRLFERLLRRAGESSKNGLSRDEFLAALVPSRPAKPLEEWQSTSDPRADAVRYLLLTMDTNRNSSVDVNEVPKDMLPLFDAMAERVDTNKNDTLDRYELGRSAPQLSQVAMRYVVSEGIDVAAELKKLQRSQGKSVRRFDEAPPTFESIGDPQKARALFAQWDGNGDGQLVADELPEPIQRQLERFIRLADRDRDGGLNESEFLTGSERLARFRGRQQDRETPAREMAAERDGMPAEAMPADDN